MRKIKLTKKNKRLLKMSLISLLIVAIIVSQFNLPSLGFMTYAVATQGDSARYFYDQLPSDAKVFYNALVEMYESGDLKKGNVSKEITNIPGLASKLEAYKNGSQALLNDMGAGRDAFLLDYPDVFYVDFDYLSIRVLQKGNDTKLYLGTGRSDNYINKEFLKINSDGSIDETATKAEIDKAIGEVKTEFDKIVARVGGGTTREKVEKAHDEIVKLTKYTYEYQTEHPNSVRTVYGVFGLGDGQNVGNAVCEGFARALKAVLDELEIPAILVRGIYLVDGNVNQPEEHMWVYVQIDGDWYAVDPTFDNGKAGSNGREMDETGVINHEYLLVGEEEMVNHVPTGIISTSEFEFEYPTLFGGVSADDKEYTEEEMMNIVYKNASGIVVIDTLETVTNADGTTDKIYHVSLNGKSFERAAEEDGLYMIFNFWQDKVDANGSQDKLWTKWLYPAYEGSWADFYQRDVNDEYTVVIPRYDNGFIVGITDVPKSSEEPTEFNAYNVYYEGGDAGILNVSSDILTDRDVSEYPAPFVKRTTPSHMLKQRAGKSYHVIVEYDQELVYTEENTAHKVGYELKFYDLVYGFRDPENTAYKKDWDISNLVLNDDNKTIEFDLKVSSLWELDETLYMIQFTGIVGAKSGKAPNHVEYAMGGSITGCIYALRAMGVDMEAYGKPTLIDDFDLGALLDVAEFKEDTDDEKFAEDLLAAMENSDLGDLLKHRISLVTTSTSSEQDAALKSALDSGLIADGRELDSSNAAGKTKYETYNIALSLCGKELAKLTDGTGIRIKLGFPQGYGPDDAGVTFTAYHFKEENGKYIAEPIPCEVTEFGLIITVYSFSPFAIAAVEKTPEEEASTTKKVVFSVTEGGSVIDADSNEKVDTVTDFNPNSSKNFEVVANQGYAIDEAWLGGKLVCQGVKNCTVAVNYDQLLEDSTFIRVAFAAESVHEADKDRGTLVTQQVTGSVSTFSTILEAHKSGSDVGNGELIDSNTKLNPGDTFSVLLLLERIEEGNYKVNAISGKLNFDSSKLELVGDLVGNNIWAAQYNKSNGKFILETVNSELSGDGYELFRATFKVKENVSGTAEITVSDLQGGTSKSALEASNPIAEGAPRSITLTIEEKEEDPEPEEPEDPVEDSLRLKEEAAAAKVVIKETADAKYVILPVGMSFNRFMELIYPTENAPTYNQKVGDQLSNVIKTGESVTVGETTWTFVARGDVDGDGKIGTNDVSKIKAYIIENEVEGEELTGAYLEAAETDNDGKPATVNDLSRIKLAVIEKLDNNFEEVKNN